MPLKTNSSIAQVLLARRRIASGARRMTPERVMVIPAATRPEASFIRASPCKMPMIFFGMRPSPTIPDSATASVGDSTAASAKAGISGIPGTTQ